MVLEARHADVAEYLDPLRIDDVRQVMADLARPPLLGGGRAVLLGELTGATREAQNALLRIVEEPPDGLAFVGEAERASDLLPTLQSRFTLERMLPLPREQVLEQMRKEQPDAGEDLLQVAARFGKGFLDPALQTLAAVSAVIEQLPPDDGSPDWFVRVGESVESFDKTWLNGLAAIFAARFESTADQRFLRAWKRVEEIRAALLRNANARLAADVLFSELSELGVLRHGAGGWHPFS